MTGPENTTPPGETNADGDSTEPRNFLREIVHQETATLADEIRVLRQEIQGLKSFLKQG